MVLFCFAKQICNIFFNSFGDNVIESLKSGKNVKKWSRSNVKARKNLQIYSWYSLPDFKHDQRHFIQISSSNIPEMRPFALFSQFYKTVTMETMIVTKF